MKRTILTMTLLMGVLVGTAQVTITTERECNCLWDDEKKEFSKDCVWDEEAIGKLEFNRGETYFKHTNQRMTSTYYVDGTNHKEEDDRQLYVYYVTSDVGNKYIVYCDLKYSEVRFLSEKGAFLLTNLIKSVYVPED